MAEQKTGTNPLLKWGIIIGAIIFVICIVVAALFVFFLPTMIPDAGDTLEIPEVLVRMGIVFVIFIIFVVFLAAIAYVIWALFFRKKEIHIVKEHEKIIKESAMLNPVSTLGSLIMTGKNQIQHYELGKIVGHTQVPVKFQRYIIQDKNGNEMPESESIEEYEQRRIKAIADGRGSYDFFAFVNKKGVYALPLFSLLEPVKVFACYPCERNKDLIGDIEIYDVGTWKYYSLYVPAGRAQEPLGTLEDLKAQILPVAITNLMDYIGLVAQRGIEGDTSMQKWLESKASVVNVKQNP